MQLDVEKNNNSVIEHFKSVLSFQAKPIIASLFGDVVLPYGGKIWLENLTRLVEPLGINSRLVRTTLFRLGEEDWVYGTKQGRKSYYQLTDKGLDQTALAEQLIYHYKQPDWDGSWTFVFLVIKPIDAEARSALEEQLKWMGFGMISKHVWAHPDASLDILEDRIKKLGVESKVVCMRAKNIYKTESGLTLDDAQLANLCSPYSEVEKKYQSFVDVFQPLYQQLDVVLANSKPADIFALRVLLIDEFRRIVLRDPHLPAQLLPDNWVGDTARVLCSDIYKELCDSSNQYFSEVCADNTGFKIRLSDGFSSRFSG